MFGDFVRIQREMENLAEFIKKYITAHLTLLNDISDKLDRIIQLLEEIPDEDTEEVDE